MPDPAAPSRRRTEKRVRPRPHKRTRAQNVTDKRTKPSAPPSPFLATCAVHTHATLTMQDAMSLTRTLKLDRTMQRRAHLYSSDLERAEESYKACDGDVASTLEGFGLHLDEPLLDRFVNQAHGCTAADWMEKYSEGGSPLLQEVIDVIECAYAHPIQYGEDLRLACARGQDERVRELLLRGCDPRARDGMGWTALHHAAQYGRVSTIKLIKQLWTEADVNACDNVGWTPFMNAIAGDLKDAAAAILALGGSPSIFIEL